MTGTPCDHGNHTFCTYRCDCDCHDDGAVDVTAGPPGVVEAARSV